MVQGLDEGLQAFRVRIARLWGATLEANPNRNPTPSHTSKLGLRSSPPPARAPGQLNRKGGLSCLGL